METVSSLSQAGLGNATADLTGSTKRRKPQNNPEKTQEKTVLATYIEGLSENTARIYKYWLTKLLVIMKISDQELLNQAKKDVIQVWNSAKSASKNEMKDSGRRTALNALKGLLRSNGIYPPYDRLTWKRVETEEESDEIPPYLTQEQIQLIIKVAKTPFNYIFQLMYEGFWGAKEFLRFNSEDNWKRIKENLASNPNLEYLRFNKKGRKGSSKPFHAVVSAKLLQEIIGAVPVPLRTARSELMLNMTNYLTAEAYLEKKFRQALKDAELTEVITHGHVSLHEIRDTAKTEATTHGVSYEVAEFMMGHIVDARGYEKCWRDDHYVWSELQKVRSREPEKLGMN